MLKIAPLSLSVEEAATTSCYLKELSDQSPSVTVGVQSLFGRCCLAAVSGFDFKLDELAREAATLGNRILSHPEPDKLGLDPLLLIETYKMLTHAGADVAVLYGLLDRVASELLAQPTETQCVGRVRSIASQLASLGFPVRPAKPAKEMAGLLRSPDRWFGASVAQLAEIADHLMADQRQLADVSTRILSLIALAELRNYRVDLGCALLRTVFQLGESCPESTDALNFIALQRRRDGRYGFPNQFAEAPEPDNDQHLSLYLLLTVNAAWLFRNEADRRRLLQSVVSV